MFSGGRERFSDLSRGQRKGALGANRLNSELEKLNDSNAALMKTGTIIKPNEITV